MLARKVGQAGRGGGGRAGAKRWESYRAAAGRHDVCVMGTMAGMRRAELC